MKNNLIFIAILVIVMSACKNSPETKHDEHEEAKFQYSAYNDDLELFVEADPFVIGESANILSHFSDLPDFTAVESGTVTICLTVNGKETKQTLEKPTRNGIYSFDLVPETVGKGNLVFNLQNDRGSFQISVSDVTVYSNEKEAHEVAESMILPKTNTIVFTKEQSWKIDFATEKVVKEPFGQVIKTIAQVQSAQDDEILISAKTNGIVLISANNVLEGKSVNEGQTIFSISGSGMAENNSSVRFAEAQNNFEKAQADYERLKELANDKIVSEKELLNAKNQYDNTKAVFENLQNNFSASGEKVKSTLTGYIKQVLVKNGQYVEAGQPLVIVSQNKTLVLHAEVQQKYAPYLGAIYSANIRTVNDQKSYTLEELNGKILSFGRSANSDNYLIPVNVQIDNTGSFISGSFVELYLKTITSSQAVTVPNSALIEEQGAFFVFVQITPELFEKREIKTGVTDGLKTEVLNGINEGERVVIKGAILVKLAQSSGTLDAHSGHVH